MWHNSVTRLQCDGRYGLKAVSASRVKCISLLTYFNITESGVAEICYVVLHSHTLQALQVTLKSVCNEGHFTLEAETVFRPHPPLIAVV
jgi:hypothetical protein